MATTLAPVSEKAVACLEAADWEGLAGCYAADVLLDMNLPTWRFQLQGRDAVRAYFVEQTGGLANLRTTALRTVPTSEGVIVEEEMRFDADGGEYLWRANDIFRVDGDEIVEHSQYCTGCWSPDDIARQSTEAPMIRW